MAGLAETIVDDALRGDSQSRKLLIERLYPMLNRHEIAGAEGEAINIRYLSHTARALLQLFAPGRGENSGSRGKGCTTRYPRSGLFAGMMNVYVVGGRE